MSWFALHPEIAVLALALVLVGALVFLGIGFHLGEANARVDAILAEIRSTPEQADTDTQVIYWADRPASWL